MSPARRARPNLTKRSVDLGRLIERVKFQTTPRWVDFGEYANYQSASTIRYYIERGKVLKAVSSYPAGTFEARVHPRDRVRVQIRKAS